MDSSDVKNNQRRSGRDSSVDEEVQKIFRKNNGKVSSADFLKRLLNFSRLPFHSSLREITRVSVRLII